MTDATAKTHVRDAALVLFAENGIATTSLRAVAAAAGVSPGLVVHHFGSKEGLRRAVDADVVNKIDVVLGGTDGAAAGQRGKPLVRLLRTQPVLVQYLGRAMAEDVEVARELFDRIFPDARPAGGRAVDPTGAERFWSSIQELVLIIGPLFLMRFLDRELGGSLLEAGNLERWIEANGHLVESGLTQQPSRRR